MIVNKYEMKKIEEESGYSSQELMDMVGKAIANKIKENFQPNSKIVILVGNGNNGGDGYTVAYYLNEYSYQILQIDGNPKTLEATHAASFIPSCFIHTFDAKFLKDADLIIDSVYGFSFHGELKSEIKKIFRTINQSHKAVWSIDINSGAECDTGHFDIDTLHSDLTIAIECYKPFHSLKKEHGLFTHCECINLNLKHSIKTKYHEMNEELFFQSFPKKSETSYKGTYGKTLIVGGGYGTAGALSLNIIGAKTVGAPYINVGLPDEIYNIVACHHITPVFHPFGHETWEQTLGPLIQDAKAIAFGSGATKLSRKTECMDKILQESSKPVVLDAEALRLLVHNTWVLRFVHCPIILTPHLGEFAALCNQPIEVIQDRKIEYAKEFSQKHKVYVVLKGPNTIVTSPSGDLYINKTGNQALAQAGSGDLLTGIIVGILTLTTDVFTAICMGVWLHGYLADYGKPFYAMHTFPIEKYPKIMNELLKKHGF